MKIIKEPYAMRTDRAHASWVVLGRCSWAQHEDGWGYLLKVPGSCSSGGCTERRPPKLGSHRIQCIGSPPPIYGKDTTFTLAGNVWIRLASLVEVGRDLRVEK